MKTGRDEADTLFDALANPTRRALVYRLDEARSMSRTAAAKELAQSSANSDDVGHLEALLHHQHLPKLAEAGLVEYDRDGGSIEATESIVPVRQILDEIPMDGHSGEE